MSELPEVGRAYEHKILGAAVVTDVRKRGRGYYVMYEVDGDLEADGTDLIVGRQRLKYWQKATKED